MTEDEAKTKDCPFFRYCINETGVVQDRDGAIYVHERCRGSGCIAWRWVHVRNADMPKDGSYVPEGFCGLAGKP